MIFFDLISDWWCFSFSKWSILVYFERSNTNIIFSEKPSSTSRKNIFVGKKIGRTYIYCIGCDRIGPMILIATTAEKKSKTNSLTKFPRKIPTVSVKIFNLCCPRHKCSVLQEDKYYAFDYYLQCWGKKKHLLQEGYIPHCS